MKKFVFLPLFFLLSCGSDTEEISPIKKSITESIYASGSLETSNQYTAYATASGIVSKIYANEGDDVFNGSPILAISSVAQQLNKDNASLVAAFQDLESNQGKLREAKQRIEVARTKMMNDSIQFNRQKQLDAKGIGSKVELETTQLTYQNSKLGYLSAKENYNDLNRQLKLNSQQAKNNLRIVTSAENDYTLKSLVEGQIYGLNVEVGEIITPQTPIAILGAKNDFILKMQVDEYDINQVKIGQKVFVTMNSDRYKTYEAKISKIYPMMNAQSKSFLVEAEFITRPDRLYPNVTFEANILVNTKSNALLIPREYLMEGDFVMKKGAEQKSKVKIGLKDYKMVEITSGLQLNDVLILPTK